MSIAEQIKAAHVECEQKNIFTKDSWRFRLGMLLPMWVPLGVIGVKVGDDTKTWFRFKVYRSAK